MPSLDATFLTSFSILGLTLALPVAIRDTVDTLTSAVRATSESVTLFFFIFSFSGVPQEPLRAMLRVTHRAHINCHNMENPSPNCQDVFQRTYLVGK